MISPLVNRLICSFRDETPPVASNNDDNNFASPKEKEICLKYIETLQHILKSHCIEYPVSPLPITPTENEPIQHYLPDASLTSIDKELTHFKKLIHLIQVDVQFRDLSFWGELFLFYLFFVFLFNCWCG